jgi:hypothetical protein
MTRLVKGYNMQQRTGTKINFRESYDELTLVFRPSSAASSHSTQPRWPCLRIQMGHLLLCFVQWYFGAVPITPSVRYECGVAAPGGGVDGAMPGVVEVGEVEAASDCTARAAHTV